MKQRKGRRAARTESETADAAIETSKAAPPIDYQPLSTHYVETARKNLASLAATLKIGDVPDDRWYGLATDALMLLIGTGCDAARMTWTPAGLAEIRQQIDRLLREGCVVATGAPVEA